MRYLVTDPGGFPIASLAMDASPSAATPLGPGGDDVKAWVEAGCPSFASEPGLAGIAERPIVVAPSDSLWGLAFLEALEAREWSVAPIETLAEFDEEQHPRDDHGKFTDSGGEGDSAVVMVEKKVKAAPATKDQISKAMEMKKAGHSYAAIHKETGLNPKQAATIVHLANKKEKAIAEQLAAKAPDPMAGPQKASAIDVASHTVEFNKVYGTYDVKNPAGKTVASAPSKAVAEKTATDFSKPIGSGNKEVFGAKLNNPYMTKEQQANLAPGPNNSIINAKGEKFEWKEKTTGPQTGKYAYFKDGVQVSSAHPAADHEKGAATIYQNKGPGWIAPTPAPASVPDKSLGIVEKGAGTSKPWPISDDVSREMGDKYQQKLEEAGTKWAAGLTPHERSAVVAYTGSAYGSINSELRANPNTSLSGRAKDITSALAKGSQPPPPDLVWRGVGGQGAKSFMSKLEAGDVIRMDGFQSTSINPSMNKSLHEHGVLFEIRPSRGAYVRPISSHKGEYEYLLPHGAKYTVHGVTKVAIGTKGVKSYHVVQLDMHP